MAARLIFLEDFLLLQLVELFSVEFIDLRKLSLEFLEQVGVFALCLIVELFVLGVEKEGRLVLGSGFGDAVIFDYVSLKLFAFLDDEYLIRHAGGGVFGGALFGLGGQVPLVGALQIHAAVVLGCAIDGEVFLLLGEVALEGRQDHSTLIVVQIVPILVLAVLGQLVSVDGVDGLALFVEHLAGRVEVEGNGLGCGVVVLLEVEVDVFGVGVGGVRAAIAVV